MKGLKHDMKNHLETVDSLLTQNKGCTAVCRTADRINQEGGSCDCSNNPLADTILNLKLENAKRNQIKFDYQINIPGSLLISYEKVTAILGNILDNAIET